MFLRALQIGLSYEEAYRADVGVIHDLMIEKGNDSFEYPIIGTTDDFRKL
jgi:hypothetical protein